MTKELYINNNLIDLGELNVAMSFQCNDIAKPSTFQSSYTNQLKLPRSANNEIKTEHSGNFNSTTNKPYERNKFDLIINGYELVRNGFAIIDGSDKKNLLVRGYSGIKDFFTELGDKKLSDLVLPEWQWDWNVFSFLNAFPSNGVCMPLINYGTINELSEEVIANNLFPAMYVSYLMQEIAKQNGFNLTGKFLSELDYTKRIIPFSNEYPTHSQKWKDARKLKALSTSDQDFPSPLTVSALIFNDDSIAGYDTESVWSIPVSGSNKVEYSGQSRKVKFKISLLSQLTVTDPILGRGAQILVIDMTTAITIDVIKIDVNLPNQVVESSMLTIYKHNVQFFLEYGGAGASFKVLTGSSIDVIEYGDEAIYGTEWEFATNMPDITQKEFFKSICYEFGIIPTPVYDSNEIEMRLFKELYENKPYAKDWTEKLIQDAPGSQDNYHPENMAQNNYYKWKDAVAFEKVVKGYGDGNFIINDKSLKDSQTVFTQCFSATPEFNYPTINTLPLINSISLDDEKKSCTPRILETKQITLNAAISVVEIRNNFIYEKYSDSTTYGPGTFGSPNIDPEPKVFYNDKVYQYVSGLNTKGVEPGSDSKVWQETSSTFSEWDSSKTYRPNSASSRYVKHGGLYYFLKKESNSTNEEPGIVTNSWMQLSNFIISFPLSATFEPLKYDVVYAKYFSQMFEQMFNHYKDCDYYFKLEEKDVQNIDYLIPIYLQQLSSYFYLNIAKNFIPGKPTACKLIRL